MNWVLYYAPSYYGTTLLANFISDMSAGRTQSRRAPARGGNETHGSDRRGDHKSHIHNKFRKDWVRLFDRRNQPWNQPRRPRKRHRKRPPRAEHYRCCMIVNWVLNQ